MEHGIAYNKPHMSGPGNLKGSGPSPYEPTKTKSRQSGQGGASGYDTPFILIPLCVIGEEVFCIAMVRRYSTGPTEYEVIPPTYADAYPQTNSFYVAETESLAYYKMVPVKEFIANWKVQE